MKKLSFLIVLSLMISSFAYSQHEGTLTQSNVQIGDHTYSSITVKYKIGTLMGEPTVNGSYKVTGNSNYDLPSSTVIWLKITTSNGGSGYIRLDPAVPEVNGEYGYNCTGSPNWDNFICGFSGTEQGDCQSAESAKEIYKNGSINSFKIAW